MKKRIKRTGIPFLAALMAACAVFIFPPEVVARGEEQALVEEANRLTYEILDLRARRKAAAEQQETLRSELNELDLRIATVQTEMEGLREELNARKEAYDNSLRSLYIRGEAGELEVLLEARELEEMWEEADYLGRVTDSHLQALRQLKEKMGEWELRERDLRECKERRGRLAESLDVEKIDSRIADLESRLNAINARLRELRSNGGCSAKTPTSPPPAAWSVPPAGKLLDRVPTMPPLSDFERTGIVFSGYTTSYGAEFHGRPTASGVIYNMYDFTCAHRTLPFGTWLLVSYRGRQVIVQVNDRGPFVPGRVLDLSFGAAQSIGLEGVQWTEFEVIVPRGG